MPISPFYLPLFLSLRGDTTENTRKRFKKEPLPSDSYVEQDPVLSSPPVLPTQKMLPHPEFTGDPELSRRMIPDAALKSSSKPAAAPQVTNKPAGFLSSDPSRFNLGLQESAPPTSRYGLGINQEAAPLSRYGLGVDKPRIEEFELDKMQVPRQPTVTETQAQPAVTETQAQPQTTVPPAQPSITGTQLDQDLRDRILKARSFDDLDYETAMLVLGQMGKSLRVPVFGRMPEETFSDFTKYMLEEKKRERDRLRDLALKDIKLAYAPEKKQLELENLRQQLRARGIELDMLPEKIKMELGIMGEELKQKQISNIYMPQLKQQEVARGNLDILDRQTELRSKQLAQETEFELKDINSPTTKALQKVLARYGINASNLDGYSIMKVYEAFKPIFQEVIENIRFKKELAIAAMKDKKDPKDKIQEILSKNIPEHQYKAYGSYKLLQNSVQSLDELNKKRWQPSQLYLTYLSAFGLPGESQADSAFMNAARSWIYNNLLDEDEKLATTSLMAILESVGRQASGARISGSEWANYNRIYGFQHSDDPKVQDLVKKNRQELIDRLFVQSYDVIMKHQALKALRGESDTPEQEAPQTPLSGERLPVNKLKMKTKEDLEKEKRNKILREKINQRLQGINPNDENDIREASSIIIDMIKDFIVED